jgi:quinol monooxygenase YgiN
MPRRFTLLTLFVAVLVLASILYFNRERLLHVVIAYRAWHAHIFTPPAPRPGESRIHRLRSDIQFYWDFAEIPLARAKRLKQVNPVLRPLVEQITRAQDAGADMHYSMHIYREIRWLLNFTPDLNETWADVDALRKSLSQPEMQKLAAEQQPDGSWALGINIWYLKMYYSVDHIEQCAGRPMYPLSFLDRINSPEKLTGELDSALYDNFTRSGAFNRERLDETFSGLARLLNKSKPSSCYVFHPKLAEALRAFVNRWQNPATGCWGQWLVDREGRVWKMDDMGMTFHVVSDLRGEVKHLDQVAKRLLQLVDVNFPAGLHFNGHYENHLNADAVIILRYAWPTLDATTRESARREISRMLTWSLTKSLQPDGSFKPSDLDDTASDAYEYGVWFLDEAGYFNKQKRFWTDQYFPNAQEVHDRIASKLKATGLSDPGLKKAYDMLEGSR